MPPKSKILAAFLLPIMVFLLYFSPAVAVKEVQNQGCAKRKAKKSSRKSTKSKLDIKDVIFKQYQELLDTTRAQNDNLFEKIQVRISSSTTDESYETTLKDFLGGTKDPDVILRTALKETSLEKAKLKEIFQRVKPLNFALYFSYLWGKNYIDQEQYQKIIQEYAQVSFDDLLGLFEKGAVELANSAVLEIKTGEGYGDLLKLDSKLLESSNQYLAVKEKAVSTNLISSSENIMDYMSDPEYYERLLTLIGEDTPDLLDNWNVGHIIDHIRRNFLLHTLINSTTWFSPMSPGSAVMVNMENSTNASYCPESFEFLLSNNHYFEDRNMSMNNSLLVNPLGVTYSGGLNFEGYGPSWWLSYSNQYLGAGFNFTKNLDQGAAWSNSQPTFLTFGGSVAGWKDYIQVGGNMQTMLADATGVGVSAAVSISRSHNVTYLGKYPRDGKIAHIRGFHKLEIEDFKGVSGYVGVSVNGNQQKVPVSVAFRADARSTKRKVYRTHKPLKETQDMLSEEGVAGLLYLLGKKIKHTNIPDFTNPEDLQEGDEIVQIKEGSLMGSFVLGLASAFPLTAARIGASVQVRGEFELGLRRLPGNKFEVSVEPVKVLELSLFQSILNFIGAGQVKKIAMAKKQIFMFDFNNELARQAYYRLINDGILPMRKEITIHSLDRGAEYLISEFRAQNKRLLQTGVARTYIDQVDIDARQLYAAVNPQLVPAAVSLIDYADKKIRKNKKKTSISFEGYEFEKMRANSTSLSSNGLISVLKQTVALRKAQSQGFSGKYSKEIFITHKRVHTIKETPDNSGQNNWNLDSIMVDAIYHDTIITGNEENKMAQKINTLFSAFIECFEIKNTKTPRKVHIRREISKHELFFLTKLEARENVTNASLYSGINEETIKRLLDDLIDKHVDLKGQIVQKFIASKGMRGFAAIHHLLGGNPEKLMIHSEAGYTAAILDAQKFIAKYSNPEVEGENQRIVIFDSLDTKSNRHLIKDFYEELRVHIRNLDFYLRLLHDDKYFIDDSSSIRRVYSKEKVNRLISLGVRQSKTPLKQALVSARDTILNLLDYEAQGFSEQEIYFILKSASSSDIRFVEKAFLEKLKHKQALNKSLGKKKIKKRFKMVWHVIKEIEEKMQELDKDDVMKKMDPKYVETLMDSYENLLRDLEELVETRHLAQDESLEIAKLFNHKERKILGKFERFRKRINDDLRIREVFLNNEYNDWFSSRQLNHKDRGHNHRSLVHEGFSLQPLRKAKHKSFSHHGDSTVFDNPSREIKIEEASDG